LVESKADSCSLGTSFFPLDRTPHTEKEKSDQQVKFQALVNVGQNI
jgi:hypothetical protein